MDITTIFITALFAGGLTCLAVQGGLLVSSITQQEEDKLRHLSHIVPIMPFVIHPPKFLSRNVRNQSKHNTFFCPALLGSTTVLTPWGATRAGMAYPVT